MQTSLAQAFVNYLSIANFIQEKSLNLSRVMYFESLYHWMKIILTIMVQMTKQ